MAFVCPRMGSCCVEDPDGLEQRARSKRIDKLLEKDKQHYRRQVKLLLLGAGESGKSTFLKQMKIIHGYNFEEETIREFRTIIYQNIVKGMKVLVDARDKLFIEWENSNNVKHANYVLKFENSMNLDTKVFLDYVPVVKQLWQDNGIRTAYDRRREFQLVKYILYLLVILILIFLKCTNSYRPTLSRL